MRIFAHRDRKVPGLRRFGKENVQRRQRSIPFDKGRLMSEALQRMYVERPDLLADR